MKEMGRREEHCCSSLVMGGGARGARECGGSRATQSCGGMKVASSYSLGHKLGPSPRRDTRTSPVFQILVLLVSETDSGLAPELSFGAGYGETSTGIVCLVIPPCTRSWGSVGVPPKLIFPGVLLVSHR